MFFAFHLILRYGDVYYFIFAKNFMVGHIQMPSPSPLNVNRKQTAGRLYGWPTL